jgi:hypothetical protein
MNPVDFLIESLQVSGPAPDRQLTRKNEEPKSTLSRLQKAEAPMVSTPGLFLLYIVAFQSIHSIRRKLL